MEIVLDHTRKTFQEIFRSRVQGAIGFGFASHWLKNWLEICKPITKRSNRNLVITFDSHMKTALSSFIKQFSNDIDTKVITSTNHNMSKQRDEPIRIPSNWQ